MSYSLALAGSTPNPIPGTNTADATAFTVGSYVYAPPIAALVPWLDANLSVRNVNLEQSALNVPDLVRSTLTALGASVSDARWVAGGYLYTRWRPSQSQPAVQYATAVRDALLQAALRISPQSQVIMRRFRVNMPTGRQDIYVYPTGSVPAPPPPVPGTRSSEGPLPTEAQSAGGIDLGLVAAGVVGATVLIGGIGFALYRRNRQQLKSNRRGRRRRR